MLGERELARVKGGMDDYFVYRRIDMTQSREPFTATNWPPLGNG